VHVAENRPAELEHPTQGALPDFAPAAFTGAAFAPAIDWIATTPTKKNDGTFMGYHSQVPGPAKCYPGTQDITFQAHTGKAIPYFAARSKAT
jgi:hypothetical protein